MSSFCKCKSYSHFLTKNFSIYAIFNDTLTNSIVSFEQLGHGVYYIALEKVLFLLFYLSTKKQRSKKVFLFLHVNICCGFSLEVPNECPQHMFSWRNKKNINTFGLKKASRAIVVVVVFNQKVLILFFFLHVVLIRSILLKLF